MIKQFCPRGHDILIEGYYISKRDGKRCRRCCIENVQNFRKRHPGSCYRKHRDWRATNYEILKVQKWARCSYKEAMEYVTAWNRHGFQRALSRVLELAFGNKRHYNKVKVQIANESRASIL